MKPLPSFVYRGMLGGTNVKSKRGGETAAQGDDVEAANSGRFHVDRFFFAFAHRARAALRANARCSRLKWTGRAIRTVGHQSPLSCNADPEGPPLEFDCLSESANLITIHRHAPCHQGVRGDLYGVPLYVECAGYCNGIRSPFFDSGDDLAGRRLDDL